MSDDPEEPYRDFQYPLNQTWGRDFRPPEPSAERERQEAAKLEEAREAIDKMVRDALGLAKEQVAREVEQRRREAELAAPTVEQIKFALGVVPSVWVDDERAAAQRAARERALEEARLARVHKEYDTDERRAAIQAHLERLGVDERLRHVREIVEMSQGMPASEAARKRDLEPPAETMNPGQEQDLSRDKNRERDR